MTALSLGVEGSWELPGTGSAIVELTNWECVMSTIRICMMASIAAVTAGTGCASIQTTSQSLPGVEPPGFSRVMVAAPLGDLDLRTSVELSVARTGAAMGVEVVPYHDVFLIGREYPLDDVMTELDRLGIDGMLFINDATQDPPTITSHARAVPLATGDVVVTGAQGTRQDRFTIVTQAFALSDEEQVWFGSTRVLRRGATDGMLISGFAKDLMRTLLDDGVILVRSPSDR
jgi:hypothetical protein